MKKRTPKTRARIIVIVITLFALLLMAGCGGKDEPSGEPYDYDLSEYLVLGQYKGIEVPAPDIVVTEEDIDEEIEDRMNALGQMEEITEGFVEYGDTANIDFEGKRDGIPFDGGTAEGHELVIGSGQFIDGFEDGLVGVAIGDTVVLDLSFPEQYHSADLAGQAVEFTVTVHFVTRVVPATFDLAYVETHSAYTSIEDYREAVREELQTRWTEEAEHSKGEIVWSAIVNDTRILKYPDNELRDFVMQSMAVYQNYAQLYQMSWPDFLTEMIGMTASEFEMQLFEDAQVQVGQEMILFAIARAEGLEITEQEYQAGIMDFLESQGFASEQDFRDENDGQSLEEIAGKKNIVITLLAEKVFDFVISAAIEV